MLHRLVTTALVLFAAATVSSCKGADVKESGGVEVKLRRVVVAEGGFEQLRLNVIAVVANGSSGDVQVSDGKATVTFLGEAKEQAEAKEGEEAEEPAAEEAPAEGGAAPEFGGKSFTGQGGSGNAVAFNDSEVIIPVVVDLPEDAESLEKILDWKKARVSVNGSLTVAGKQETFGGMRDVAPPHLPTVVLQEAQIASQDEGKNGAAFFRLGLDNKNPFEVSVDRFAWGVSVGGKELRPMGEGQSEQVPGSSVASFEDQVEVDEKAFGPALKALLKQPSVPYTIDGFIEVQGIKKPFHFAGDMQFAR